MSTRTQPEWRVPVNSNPPPTLKLYNSLTRSKVEFTPVKGKQVTWYNCGPTVYDASHVGHARLYVTVDILRRVLTDYFNYDVLFVMNITDIDDKIIVRARHNLLFEEFKSSITSLTRDLITQIKKALQFYTKNVLKVGSNSDENDPKYLMHTKAFHAALEASAEADVALDVGDDSKEAALKLLTGAQDVLTAWLDDQKGASVTDPRLFRDLAAHWEKEFMKDMETLNVRPCDIITRVSEYIPEITTFVQKIMDNGYAYTADGSVYFDTASFDGKKGHHYAKLQPWSAGNLGLLEEGEGSLGSKLAGKKNPSDFALWKKSKPGEPAWQSTWGPGRPGWHIECSVMASEVLGSTLDIHSGGIDLAFPHHDNEIAQSEAYHGSHQWVNYFLHPGHLHVEGQKMSKSLKNFISVRDALNKYTPRQIRMCFLLHQWDSKLDFKESTMLEARSTEITINNFFMKVKALINENKGEAHVSDGKHRYRHGEKDLIKVLREKQAAVHNALCDSINTPAAMNEILELINKTNIYLSAGRSGININIIEKVAAYITKMLAIFGLVDTQKELGFGSSDQSATNKEETLLPYLRALSEFRDDIRDLSRQNKPHSEILALCDRLRDVELVELGVALEDQDDGKALVKLADKEELIKLRDEKMKAQAEKTARKDALAKAKEAERLAALEKGKVAPIDMFKEAKDDNGELLYSAFDEQGIPTHNADGTEVSNSKIKKLKKEWEKQQKLHTNYLEWKKTDNS
ncbi:7665_t:CDS:10 [Paraglomus occultum]|uniref:cysteine--tRNA ligase n=1 Tax=Paraglomus occultum TaxID=144539 RepID=A0A9N9A4V0_9GLOM|nr:7665_t:CDS:10 [Paraglomus occultum]